MGIGRRTLELLDPTPRSFYEKKDPRIIPLSFFYPTPGATKGHYADLYAPRQDLLRFIYPKAAPESLEELPARFQNNAPLINRARPLVVFSHGLMADRDFYLFLIEPLVEAGFHVLCTGHLYDTDWTLLPSGPLVPMKEGLLAEASLPQRQQQIAARVLDLRFVLDHLPEVFARMGLGEDSLPESIFLCGHSLGAMTALGAMDHPRVQAGALLDGAFRYLQPENLPVLQKPLLNLRRDGISYAQRLQKAIERSQRKSPEAFRRSVWHAHEEGMKEREYSKRLKERFCVDPRFFLSLRASVHMSFCDWFLLYPQEWTEMQRSVAEIHEEIVTLVGGFFLACLHQRWADYFELVNKNTSFASRLEEGSGQMVERGHKT
ncbi:hypothetical protein ABB02_01502 [Clostridiaceae bacterium JG1575]|nr:hypothetical protein ABB02_01502 [Clostridiaceae bacterium JG1575]